jgi:hypothetical protein
LLLIERKRTRNVLLNRYVKIKWLFKSRSGIIHIFNNSRLSPFHKYHIKSIHYLVDSSTLQRGEAANIGNE